MRTLFLDLTELLANPLRTGIQRVERKIIEHWPGVLPTPVFVDNRGEFRSLSPKIYEYIIDDTSEGVGLCLAAAVKEAVANAVSFPGVSGDVILNLELFFDVVRSKAYQSLGSRGVKAAWYVHDFIPFLKPNHFHAEAALYGMPYIRALRELGDRLSFNSWESRDDCANRILKRPEGVGLWPVISCGADGLGIERQTFNPGRVSFISIGTIEKRKNTLALLQAFETLWDEGYEVPLVLAGKFGAEDADLRSVVERNRGSHRFRYLNEPSDAVLCDEFSKARALIMPSEVEGFGIPPVEALFAGVPAILSASIPSARLISGGAIKLKDVNSQSIVDAIKFIQNDSAAFNLWRDAAVVVLPTWQNAASKVADWVSGL